MTKRSVLEAIHFAVAHRDEIVQSMRDILEEEPRMVTGKLALALCEIYPELHRDQMLDLIELERPNL